MISGIISSLSGADSLRRSWRLLVVGLSLVLTACGGRTAAPAPQSVIEAESAAADPAPDSLDGEIPSAPVTAPVVARPPEPSLRAADLISGHRVQVFTSGLLAEAETVRDAIRDTGLSAYVEYRAPLYRVRIGDCTDIAEARALREQAVAMGYERAVVVPTLIRAAAVVRAPMSRR
jgi:cell division protein FtsN